MKNARQSSKQFGDLHIVGNLTNLEWVLASEATAAGVGTLAIVIGGVLSLALLAF